MEFKDQNIKIAGFKHNLNDFRELMAQINEISNDCNLQLLNADGIAGEEHALHSAVHAIKAFERGENIANDLGLEICLRASAQRQISKALNILGIKKGHMNICAVAIGCKEDIIEELENILDERDDKVLKPDENNLKEIYNVSDEEIDAAGSITNVMIERTTLLILDS
jgi:KEOPS complex subunit Cgi121